MSDVVSGWEKMCGARSGDGAWVCTLDVGHDGLHGAHSGESSGVRWPDSESDDEWFPTVQPKFKEHLYRQSQYDALLAEVARLERQIFAYQAERTALLEENERLREVIDRAGSLQHVTSLFSGGYRPPLAYTLVEAITELAEERDAARAALGTRQADSE